MASGSTTLKSFLYQMSKDHSIHYTVIPLLLIYMWHIPQVAEITSTHHGTQKAWASSEQPQFDTELDTWILQNCKIYVQIQDSPAGPKMVGRYITVQLPVAHH